MIDNSTATVATMSASRSGRVLQASWTRSRQSGLDPAKPMDPPTAGGVDTGSRLFRAATPVLERVRDEIDGERYSVMLVGAQAEMLTTVNGCRPIDAVVERIGATPGALWREDTTGTNALATPFETRKPLFVRGREHYVEGLHDYSCYGRPIFDPMTGRLLGVLDIMSDAGAESALMRPFVDAAIVEIERNIRQSVGNRTRSVIRAFEEAARHPAAIVVAISRSVMLQSSAAARVLSPTDIALLQQLAHDLRASTTVEVTLGNGHTARVELEPVDNSDGVLVRAHTRQRPMVPRTAERLRSSSRVRQWIEDFPGSAGSGVIVGESGSGRSTALADATGDLARCAIDGRALYEAEAERRLRAFAEQPGDRLLTIDDLDRLPAGPMGIVEEILVSGRHRVLAGTGIPDPADVGATRLLHLFENRLDLPALRDQRSELLATLDELAGPGVRYRFTPQATRVLESYSWPGNHRELASVLRSLARSRGTLIDAADLPIELRMKSTVKTLTPWQQASCDAIMRAMEISHGNKAHAADYLGISRSTLYHHIKEYGIIV
ncbi:sigma-54-dependent Fis family transcriptional regulator [Gordonia sp. NPDC003376]